MKNGKRIVMEHAETLTRFPILQNVDLKSCCQSIVSRLKERGKREKEREREREKVSFILSL